MTATMPGNPSRHAPGEVPPERIGHETHKGGTVVLVADGGAAHLFERLPDGRVQPMPAFSREAVTVREHEAGGDRPGRAFPAAHASARSAMEPATDPDRLAEERFLDQALADLAKLKLERGFAHWFLFAPPQALGHIRKAMPAPLGGCLIAAAPKDLVKAGTDAIARHVLALEQEARS